MLCCGGKSAQPSLSASHNAHLLYGTVLVHVDELEYGEEVVSVGIALPVAFSLDQGLLDSRDKRFMSLHYDLQ